MSAPTVPHDYVGDQRAEASRQDRPEPVPAGRSAPWRPCASPSSCSRSVMVLVFFGTLGMMRDSIDEHGQSLLPLLGRDDRPARAHRLRQGLPRLRRKDSELPVKVPFPGGYTIGWLMFINLLAAHAIRFKLTWKRSGIFLLHAGVIVLLAGEFLTGQMAVETRMMHHARASRHDSRVQPDRARVGRHRPVRPQRRSGDRRPGGSMIDDAKRSDWISHPDVPFDVQRRVARERPCPEPETRRSARRPTGDRPQRDCSSPSAQGEGDRQRPARSISRPPT